MMGIEEKKIDGTAVAAFPFDSTIIWGLHLIPNMVFGPYALATSPVGSIPLPA
jgi:hypothetical protein